MPKWKGRKDRPPQIADTRSGRWMGIPHCVMKSEAYRHLTAMERAVLSELVLRLNGSNNEQIAISYRELAHRLNRKNQSPFARAFATLIKHGFIEVTLEGSRLLGRAREYRLTFVNTTDKAGRPAPATNDYLRWSPEKKSDATAAGAKKCRAATASVAKLRKGATDVVVPFTRNRQFRGG